MRDHERGVPDNVKVIQVIEVVSIRGSGTQDDPVRKMTQYWSLDGKLLAVRDDLPRVTAPERS